MNATRNTYRPRNLKATDQQLIDAYAELGNVHKVGAKFDMRGSSVHERLVKLGVAKKMNKFTEADFERLRREYPVHTAAGTVKELADSMGRTVQFLSRKARILGLTDNTRPKTYAGRWKYLPDEEARAIFDDFKRSLMTLSEFCASRNYSDDGMLLAIRNRWPDEWEHAIEVATPIDTPYRKGRIFEYKVRDDLQGIGYHAMRSNRSATPADVIAFRHSEILFVQCKGIVRDVPTDEWNNLFEIAESVNAIPVIASPDGAGNIVYERLLGFKDGIKQNSRPLTSFQPSACPASTFLRTPGSGESEPQKTTPETNRTP